MDGVQETEVKEVSSSDGSARAPNRDDGYPRSTLPHGFTEDIVVDHVPILRLRAASLASLLTG